MARPVRRLLASKAARKSAPYTGVPKIYDSDGETVDGNEDGTYYNDSFWDSDKENTARSSRKRSCDSDDVGDSPAMKRVDRSIEELESTIAELQSQIKELHDFITKSGLTFKAPSSKSNHITSTAEDHASALADAIKRDMAAAYKPLAQKCSDAAHTGVTSDDISAAMAPFISEIAKLAKFPGQPGNRNSSLEKATDLLVLLGDYSYGELDTKHGCGFGDRPSDGPANDLMVVLLKQRLLNEPNFPFAETLSDLNRQSKHLAGYGIGKLFVKSIKLMKSWT